VLVRYIANYLEEIIMVYTDRPSQTTERRTIETNNTGFDYGDRIHWGAILAGLVIAISTQLVLSALGTALGFTNIANSGSPRTDAGGVGIAVGIWAIVSLFISLFVGGWVTSSACGYINRKTATLNGAILWATTLVLSALLLASGVSGAFGLALGNSGNIASQAQQSGISIPGTPNASGQTGGNQAPKIDAKTTRDVAGNAAKAGWSFTLGSLLGLVSATIGASVGARKPRPYTTVNPSIEP
jgi:hypothetical protein